MVERDVPREHDRQHDEDPGRDHHLAHPLQLAVRGEIDGEYQGRERRRDGPLGQHAQAYRGVHQEQEDAPPLRVALREREEQQRERHEHRDVDVDEDAAPEHHQPRVDRQPERCPESRLHDGVPARPGRRGRIGARPRQQERNEDHRDGAERDRDALDADRHAEHLVKRRDDPVAEDRFVETRLVVERGSDVIPALDHLPGGLDVERLVRVPDGGPIQVDEIRKDRCGKQQEQREAAGQGGHQERLKLEG